MKSERIGAVLRAAWAGLILAAGVAGAVAAPTVEPGRLPAEVVPVHYAIRLVPDAAALSFTGEVAVDVDVKATTRRIVLNAADLVVTEASVDGRKAAFDLDQDAETLTLRPARAVAPGRHRLRLAYGGRIFQSAYGFFALDYPTEGGARRVLSMQMEPGDARRVAPMWDEPARKATFDVTVLIPAGQDAFGNMPVRSRQARGDKVEVRFGTTPRMSSYLLHVTIGELERLAARVGGVDVGVVTRRGASGQGAFALQTAVRALGLYNDFFGTPYPLPKLDLIAVPGTAQTFGAMENWGAILFMERHLLLDPASASESARQHVFYLVAHEVSHQWFGNLVTMRWWTDLWLNEGFASWMSAHAAAVLQPDWKAWEQVAVDDREQALRADARASTHAIVQPVPSVRAAAQAFDTIAYEKGLSVVRMIEGVAGPEAFRDGLRRYMKRHAYGNTVTEDLWAALERTAARPVAAIARDFTEQPGVPLLRVSAGPCAEGRTPVTLSQARFETAGPAERDPQPRRWRIPLLLRAGIDGALTPVLLDQPSATVPLAGCGAVLANVGGTGYLRVAYDRAAAAALSQSFGRLPALDQLVRLSDAWALGENGDAPASDWFELVARLPADADPLVLMQASQVLRQIDRLYDGLPGQAALRAFARGRLRPAFDRIGWLRRDGEPDNVALLREQLIVALARYGDAEVLADARARFAAGDDAQLPAALKEPVLDVVAEHADASTWEALAARAAAATSPTEQRRFYTALGTVADPGLAQRALDLSLSGRLDPTLSATLLSTVGWRHPELAFRFALAHHDAVTALVETSAQWVIVPRLGGNSSDPALVEALQAYLQRVPADANASARTALAAVRARVLVKAQRLPEVTAWLNAR